MPGGAVIVSVELGDVAMPVVAVGAINDVEFEGVGGCVPTAGIGDTGRSTPTEFAGGVVLVRESMHPVSRNTPTAIANTAFSNILLCIGFLLCISNSLATASR